MMNNGTKQRGETLVPERPAIGEKTREPVNRKSKDELSPLYYCFLRVTGKSTQLKTFHPSLCKHMQAFKLHRTFPKTGCSSEFFLL